MTDTSTIQFKTPAQVPSGVTTLTVQNRAGLAQTRLFVDPPALSALQPGQITTFAGGSTYVGDGGLAVSAELRMPQAVTVDQSGDLFITDTYNSRIRRIDTRTGIITTMLESANPRAIALEKSGNVLIGSYSSYLLRYDPGSGETTVVAGTGAYGFSGDNGPAIDARISRAAGLAVDGAGNVIFSDVENHRVRKVDVKTGVITTVAGTGTPGFSADGGPAKVCQLSSPCGVALDSLGNIFIADTGNQRIRKVNADTGLVSTAAGNGSAGFSGDDGPAVNAQLHLLAPVQIATDASGSLLIADAGNWRIRKVDAASGLIRTVAGGGPLGSSNGDGGPATNAVVVFPRGIAADAGANIYIGESDAHRIRKVDARSGNITTVAGIGNPEPDSGIQATRAQLRNPAGLAIDTGGNVFVSDANRNRLIAVSRADGTMSTVCGQGANCTGSTGTISLLVPTALALDRSGGLLIADTFDHRVLRVQPDTAAVTVIAGTGVQGFSGDSLSATAAMISAPRGLAVDRSGNIYVSDTGNARVRVIDASAGIISTIAGGGTVIPGDGGPAVSAHLDPQGLATDSAGNLYIADRDNHRIRKVDRRNGTISTVAGTGVSGLSGDGGPATAARLSYPNAVIVDESGDLYVADTSNGRIRRVRSATGIIETVAGSGADSIGDGGAAVAARLLLPQALAFDGLGNLFVCDFAGCRIRAIRGPVP